MDIDSVRMMPEYAELQRQLQEILLAKMFGAGNVSEEVEVYVVESVEPVFAAPIRQVEERVVVEEKFGQVEESTDLSQEAEKSLTVEYVPMEVGIFGQVVDEYLLVEERARELLSVTKQEGFVDKLDRYENEVLERCTDHNPFSHVRAVNDEQILSVAVDNVVAVSLEEACGCSRGQCPLGYVRPVAEERLVFEPGLIDWGFPVVSDWVRHVLGSEPPVGVFLAWYARAVRGGYARPVKLVMKGKRIVAVRGTGQVWETLASVLRFIGAQEGYSLPSVGARVRVVRNSRRVMHPYECVSKRFPEVNAWDFLVEEPYCDVFTVILGNGRAALDSAVDYVVKRMAERTGREECWSYSSEVAREVVDVFRFDVCPDLTEQLLGLKDGSGSVRLGHLLAMCLWLVRRGVDLDHSLSRVGGRWVFEPMGLGGTRDNIVNVVRELTKHIYDPARKDCELDLVRVEYGRGFKFPRNGGVDGVLKLCDGIV